MVVNVKARANVVKVVVVVAVSFESLGDPLRRRPSVKPLTKESATNILVLPKEEEGGASRANDVVKVQGCGWV